jgi:NAD-dependent deacetylase
MSIEQASKILRRARSALFITGAGITAAPGVPAYRGIGGLYVDRPPDEGMTIEQALSEPMLRVRPEITWKVLHQSERAGRGATFGAAHAALARLEERLDRAWVLTQNVDGFHKSAGSQRVIDIQGDIHELMCTGCLHRERVSDYAHLPDVPRCPRCGAVIRPDLVLFGEALPPVKEETLAREIARGFDVVVSIGTPSLFPYIAHPVFLASVKGVATIEINPEETPVSDTVHVKLWMPPVEALTAILAQLDGA